MSKQFDIPQGDNFQIGPGRFNIIYPSIYLNKKQLRL